MHEAPAGRNKVSNKFNIIGCLLYTSLSKQKFDYEDRNLKMTRPAFGDHLMATNICPRFRPQMSTVRPGVMKKAPFDQAKADACQICLLYTSAAWAALPSLRWTKFHLLES